MSGNIALSPSTIAPTVTVKADPQSVLAESLLPLLNLGESNVLPNTDSTPSTELSQTGIGTIASVFLPLDIVDDSENTKNNN